MQQDMIVILDLGSNETTLLARDIRALGVYTEIHPHDITAEQLSSLPNVKGIILNGGPNRVVDGVAIDASDAVYQSGIPLMAADHRAKQAQASVDAWPEDEKARRELLQGFVYDVCAAQANWNMDNFISDQIELIRR
ncbi:MAG: glutamine-hydrolyzing GMP synthase, partial [Clostridia bacterium]|nr:glutamine-hydrolyzing GMP synthase [Clostridia bacterium]